MKVLLSLLLVALLAAGGAAGWLWYALTEPYAGFPEGGVFVDVPRGASSRAVARLLQQNGVIRSATAFEIYARRSRKRTLQAGEYFFNSATSARVVFWKIARGEVYSEPFTVREGETMFDIARDLEKAKFMPVDEFLKAASDPTMVRDIAPHAQSLEGFLYPATYNLPRHPAANELAAQMVTRFKNEWDRIAQSAPSDKAMTADGKPMVSVVTLASLVERETPKPEERPLVAGVFENRLKMHMPLQCDPTVVYALERVGHYQGSLTLDDLHFDSPYNTYQNHGLPPGPIGNPGEVALRAALQPAETDYLYFVANTQGGHFFSATLAEHNKNVQKYHRLLAGLPADPPQEETVPVKKKQPQKKATKRKPAQHKTVARRACSIDRR